MMAEIPSTWLPNRKYPFFLTQDQHDVIDAFVAIEETDDHRLLLLTGPIKSGKTAVLHDVIPGWIGKYRSAFLLNPVIFRYSFPLHTPVSMACEGFLAAFKNFAKSLGIALDKADNPLSQFAERVIHLSNQIREHGGKLWLLLDECQAPLNASDFETARMFMAQMKCIMESKSANMVITGSGMVHLLTSIRKMHPNG